MIKCYECPLQDVCQVHKVSTSAQGIDVVFNWLPDEHKSKCPLYKIASETYEWRYQNGGKKG